MATDHPGTGEAMSESGATRIPRYAVVQRQSLPLDCKIQMSEMRIRQWYEHWHGQVYVAFSGGKDSTVLLHLVRSLYPNVPAVFFNTGLEFPEIVRFVRGAENVIWKKPAMTFKAVLKKYGYPIPSKEQAMAISRYRNTKSEQQRQYRLNGFPNGPTGKISEKWKFLLDAPFKISDQCCQIMKKQPGHKVDKELGSVRFTGEMAEDSNIRLRNYMKHGCNAMALKSPASRPMAVWSERDVWDYIRQRDVPYSTIYDMGYMRTGCAFCMFGVCREPAPNRFQMMKKTHPKLWEYCMTQLGLREVLEYVGVAIE